MMEIKKEELEDNIYNGGGTCKEEELKETLIRVANLEEELDVSITRCHELSVELEKKKAEFVEIESKFRVLEVQKVEVDDELKEYQRVCNEMKEQIVCLEEDRKVVHEREKRAEERISTLEEEIKKMGNYESEKFVEFKSEIRVLECEKLKAENEIEEVWKIKCRELETQVLMLKGENLTLRGNGSNVSKRVGLEQRDLPNEVCDIDEDKKGRIEKSKFLSETNGRTVLAGSDDSSPLKAHRDEHVTGPPTIDIQSEKKKMTSTDSKVVVGIKARKELIFEREESSNKEVAMHKQGNKKLASCSIIEIVDSDDEKEIAPTHISNISDKEMVNVSSENAFETSLDRDKDLIQKKGLKRPSSDQKGVTYESYYSEEDIPFTSTPKRKRASKIVTSESEDDDKIPTSNVKMKKLEELNEGVQKLSPVNPFTENVTLSYGSHNVEEPKTPARRRLISLRQCEEKKGSADGTSKKKEDSPLSKDEKEDVEEEDDSDSEGESLGGFIVEGSDSSNSEDSCNGSEDSAENVDYGQVIATIRRNKDKRAKWQFEADMLSAFEEDPEVCMRAVCALYRQQTSEEKSIKGSLLYNNRGFSKFDAYRGTDLAEFLLDGDEEGDLKKSVEELEIYDRRGLEECQRLARRYSKQLFTIYMNNEDPFFLPS